MADTNPQLSEKRVEVSWSGRVERARAFVSWSDPGRVEGSVAGVSMQASVVTEW